MNNTRIEYHVEYVEEGTPWVVAEFTNEQEAFDKLAVCKVAAPLREWQVCKIETTYKRLKLLRTPNYRTREFAI